MICISQDAMILHVRKYRDYKNIITLWLKNYGKVTAIVNINSKKKFNNIYQPFILLKVDIKLNKKVDGLSYIREGFQTKFYSLGNYINLLSRFYVNEILYWLLPNFHQDLKLFDHYVSLIEMLSSNDISRLLCRFELHLLDSLGYGFQCDYDDKGMSIEPRKYYSFKPLSAFSLSIGSSEKLISGELIKKINVIS